MDTGSFVQSSHQFMPEELAGVLEVPDRPTMTAGYADIYQGVWTKPNGERVQVAVKELKALIPKDLQTKQEALQWKLDTRHKREIFVWSQTKHSNLHPLLGYRSLPRPQLISPWCRHGNLTVYLQANPDLSRCDKLRLIFQIACGLEYLHSRNPPICHADVKPENVLINDWHGAALSDFGLSRFLQDLGAHSGFTTSETVKGSVRYMASELFNGQKPDLQSDVFAFGGLILTVMSGKAPFDGILYQGILGRVMQDRPPRWRDHPNLPAEDTLWKLMRRCWAKNPAARPTIREVLLELLGLITNEESTPSSRPSLPPAASDGSGTYSEMDLEAADAPQGETPVLTPAPDAFSVEGLSSSIQEVQETSLSPIPENVSTEAQKIFKRVEVKSKIIPVIGGYIAAVAKVGLNLIQIVQPMDRGKYVAKDPESCMWKLVDLVQDVEEKLRQNEGDETADLVDDMQRELQSIHKEMLEMQCPDRLQDVFTSCDQAEFRTYQGRMREVLEQTHVLVNLDTACYLTELENKELQEKKRRLLNYLGDGKYGARGNAIEDAVCLPGTRMEILERIEGWIRDTSTVNRVLWIRGMAGRGKSTIASTVAHNWQFRASCALFHFRRGQNALNERIVCALARQLGSSLVPEVRNAILESVRENEDIADQRLSVQFETLLVAPLSTLKRQPHTILIVVDALDECDNPKDAEDFVKLIDRHSSSIPTNVKFLLTCRPEAPLLRALEPRKWHVEDLDLSLDVKNDIAQFFEQTFRHIRNDHGLSQEWPSHGDVGRLVEMSQGLFQWACTAVTWIGNRSPANRLHDLLNRPSMWSGLDDLYHQIFSKAFENVEQDPPKRDLLCRILGILVVAPHPVSLEVVTALCVDVNGGMLEGVDQGNITELLRQDILVDLHSLLLIPSSSSEPLCLMHNSIRDLVISKQRSMGRVYYIDITQHHERLAGACLGVMVRCLKKNICNLSDVSKANSEIQDIVDRKVSAVIRYCCRAWSIHLAEGTEWARLRADGASSLRRNFETFTKEKILYWLEVMSMLGATAEGIVTAKRVYQWLLQTPKEQSKSNPLNNLWSDTERFITAFSEPISFGPLHIYISALAHCPRKTRLWEWYGKHAKIRTVRGVQPPIWPRNLWTRDTESVVAAVAFSPDGKVLASGSSDGTIRLWDAQTGTPLGLWDAQTGTPLGEPRRGHHASVCSVAFSPEGKVLASGSYDRMIRLWDARTGTPLGEPLQGHHDWIRSVAFSPDSKVLASGSSDSTIRLWDAQTGTPLGEPLQGHHDWVCSVTFSPDGKVLASGSYDRTIRLWDGQTGTPLGEPLQGHHGFVRSVASSPDGKVLASGSNDCTIRLWDAQTGTPLRDPLQHIWPFPSSKALETRQETSDMRLVSFKPLSQAAPWVFSTLQENSLRFRDHWLVSSSSRVLWLPSQYWAAYQPLIFLSNQTITIVGNGNLSIFDVSGLV